MNDLGRFSPDPEKQLYSLGRICGIMQVTPGQVGVLIQAVGLQFDFEIDGVPYLSAPSLRLVIDKYKEVASEIDAAIAAASDPESN